ncbi:MAG TPA: hypothetical protein VLT16_16050 [Candidatus Limnocylindrales bacterium]|nr:hypothetical protein [Candidatus Limnocylindrales bacterium]
MSNTVLLKMGQTILCVSQSSAAQMTRDMVLQRAGYRVLSTSSMEAARQVFADTLIDAVVLGDSLPPDQRIVLGNALKVLKPAVPIIFLYRMSGFRVPPGIADEQVESLEDPQLLLDAVARVLHGNAKGARGH